MAGGPSIAVKVLADLKGFTTAVTGAGDHVQGVSTRMRTAFSGVTSGLNQTGVLGPFSGVLDGINASLDTISAKGKSLGTSLLGVGTAAVGVGAGLSAFGSKDQAAQQQLQQSIENTGGAYEDYGKSIEEAISHQEKYGHTANESQDALRKLTDATHDPQKALDLLGEASDIAAAKHEDLSTAAEQLGKVYNGNTKLLKPFGVEIDKTTGLTKDGKTAVQALADVTAGQAAQATDTFSGKLDGLKAKLEDQVALFGQKYGPAIQVAGIGMLALGSAIEVLPAIFGALSTAWGVLTGIELASLGPILLIIAAVAALIAIAWLLYNNWDTIWSFIKTIISDVWDWISSHWPLLLAILTGPIGIAVLIIVDHWNTIKAAIQAVYDWIVGAFQTVGSWIVKPFTWAWTQISAIPLQVVGAFQAVIDWFTNTFKDVGGYVTAPFTAAFDAIARAWNDTVGSLSFTVPDWVPGLGGKGWSVPQIPELAMGGIVTSPTLALIGEAGPEAVIPLNRLGAAGPVVHIENANFYDEADVELLMRRTAWAARTQAV